MIRKRSVVPVIFLLLSGAGFARVPEEPADSHIRLSTRVESNRVPLNRTLVFRVRVEWQGGPDRIELTDVEDPVLTNLEIVGRSAENRVEGSDRGKRAVHEIGFVLQGLSEGMGYIESAGIAYREAGSDENRHLKTGRIEVTVLPPVSEPGERDRSWIAGLAVLVFLIPAAVYVLIWYRRRRELSRMAAGPVVLLEQGFLEELKKNKQTTAAGCSEALAGLSRLYRRYLSEKYGIPAMEATTRELVPALRAAGLEEPDAEKAERFLSRADLVKFSGKACSPSEFDEAFTTVEWHLEKELARSRESVDLKTDSKRRLRGIWRKKG